MEKYVNHFVLIIITKATLDDLDKEVNKMNLRFKSVYDHCNEEIEKLRKEMNNKLEKKLDINEALKLVAEIN